MFTKYKTNLSVTFKKMLYILQYCIFFLSLTPIFRYEQNSQLMITVITFLHQVFLLSGFLVYSDTI